jgi:hypothetical protein
MQDTGFNLFGTKCGSVGSVGVGEFLDWRSDSVLQEGHCVMKLDTYNLCVKILRGLDSQRNSGKKGNLMIEEYNMNLG